MKIQIKTLGCKVNQYESQAIAEEFARQGHQITNNTADLYIINTCTVTKSADRKSRKMISRAKRQNPKAKIIACGCLAEDKNGNFLLKKAGVDQIIPQKNKHNLAKMITGGSPFSKTPWNLQIKKYPKKRAFVKIQDGCNFFCSFCKIPYLRPEPTSRQKEDILEEIKRLSLFHKEIVLCGTNTALYGRDLTLKTKLSSLVEEILSLEPLTRLRLSSLQPSFIDKKLVNLISHPKMCPHLHLSFQYGENSILKAMNKKETVEIYLEKIKAIKKIEPLTAISCDIIIGFPGETDKTFKKTINFLEAVKPMRMHIFNFSPRENTPLAKTKLPNKDTVKKRHEILANLAKKLSFDYFKNFLDKELEMVAEEKKNGFITGYTQNYIKVHLEENVPLGSLVKIKIKRIDKNNNLFAKIKR